MDDSESCDFGDLEGRWPEMSKFVSCGRNAENVNRLADFVLAQVLRPRQSAGSQRDGASAWVKMLA